MKVASIFLFVTAVSFAAAEEGFHLRFLDEDGVGGGDISNDDGTGNGNDKNGGACFSDTSTVEVWGKGMTMMKDLAVGDKVSTANSGYQTVYAFAHREPSATAEFLQLHFGSSKKYLEVTGDHLVFLQGHEYPVQARAITVGQSLLLNGDVPVAVHKITTALKTGLYAPLTADGTMLVEGIHASNYATPSQEGMSPEFVEFRGGVSSGVAQQTMTHLLLLPLRMVCLGIAPQVCENHVLLNGNGMPVYTAHLLQAASWLRDAMPGVVQAMIMAVFVALLGPLRLLEIVAGPYFAPWVIAGAAGAWFMAKKNKESNSTSKKIV